MKKTLVFLIIFNLQSNILLIDLKKFNIISFMLK